jgi:bla regulator protein blaR1
MNGFATLQQPIMQALGMAVLQSLWQGILLYCLMRITLSFVPERKSGARYSIAYATLTLMFAGFLFSFFSEWQLVSQAGAATITPYSGGVQRSAYTALLAWNHFISFRYTGLFSQYMPFIAACYALGVTLLCGKMIWSVTQAQYLRKHVMLPESLVQQRFMELKQQSGIRRNVLLRYSDKVNVPVMLGYLKPLILVPLSLVNRLDPQQMEAVLLHELAHIKRNDYLWNFLQMIMETLLFFNPATWLVSRSIRLEREHRCDDYVLGITKTPLPYAHALLLLEENRISLSSAVMAASGHNRNSLLHRIKRITSMTKEMKNTQRTLATITVVVLIAAMVCFATAFGQEKQDEPKKIKKSYSKVVVINDNGKITVDDNGKITTYPKENGDTAGMAEALKSVPQVMGMAHQAIKDINLEDIDDKLKEIDWDQMDNTIKMSMSSAEEALKDIDWEDIQSKVDKAMKEAHSSMKEVDWDKINAEMADARREMVKAVKEARVKMSDVDWAEMQQTMKKAKREAAEEIRKAKIEMKRAMKEQEKAREKDQD